MSLSFSDIDFTNVEASNGPSLKTGAYLCSIGDVEYKVDNQRGMASVTFIDDSGYGAIKQNFNLRHPSADAQRISQEQFKSLMIASDHPSPDDPGDIASLSGLKVVITVSPDGFFTGRDGNQVQSFKVASYSKMSPGRKLGPAEAAAAAPVSGGTGASNSASMNDDIPF